MSVSFEFFEGLDLRVFYRVARAGSLERAVREAVRREDGYSCDIERRERRDHRADAQSSLGAEGVRGPGGRHPPRLAVVDAAAAAEGMAAGLRESRRHLLVRGRTDTHGSRGLLRSVRRLDSVQACPIAPGLGRALQPLHAQRDRRVA